RENGRSCKGRNRRKCRRVQRSCEVGDPATPSRSDRAVRYRSLKLVLLIRMRKEIYGYVRCSACIPSPCCRLDKRTRVAHDAKLSHIPEFLQAGKRRLQGAHGGQDWG